MIRSDGREVVTLTIDLPERRNALGSAALAELAVRLSDAAWDAAVGVVVITATGTVFCAGADRSELGDTEAVELLTARLWSVLTAIAEMPKPVVCRVNGDAYGAGLAILAAADLAVTVRHARFALPEVRFGLVPTVAAAVCVPRIGPTTALDLMLTGRTIDGEEASRVGLVAAAVDDETALDNLIAARVGEFVQADAEALRHTKRLVRRLAMTTTVNTVVDELRSS